MNDLERFRKVAQPPEWALKEIQAGRLRGMTDINPAWRIQALTETYGLCGIGWKFEVSRRWTEAVSDGQVLAFVDVLLFIKTDGEWSDGIPGNGGSTLIAKERNGLHSSDEAFKMATTDALSSAMKMIGVGADVYAGQWTGKGYNTNAEPEPEYTEEQQAYIDRIKACKTVEELELLGEELKVQDSSIQDAIRPAYKTQKTKLAFDIRYRG